MGEVESFEEPASTLGYEIDTFPIMYLGPPLGARRLSVPIWERVLETMARRLAGWKTKCSLIGGRTTLLKVTLNLIPNYFLSLFPIPLGVHNKLETVFRRFIWGNGGEEEDPLGEMGETMLASGRSGVLQVTYVNE